MDIGLEENFQFRKNTNSNSFSPTNYGRWVGRAYDGKYNFSHSYKFQSYFLWTLVWKNSVRRYGHATAWQFQSYFLWTLVWKNSVSLVPYALQVSVLLSMDIGLEGFIRILAATAFVRFSPTFYGHWFGSFLKFNKMNSNETFQSYFLWTLVWKKNPHTLIVFPDRVSVLLSMDIGLEGRN